MKIHYVPYQLISRWEKSTRKGVLLQIETEEGKGYADLHPRMEWGDLPLKEQLTALTQGKTTPLLERALIHAALDRSARQKEVLLRGPEPVSHHLIVDPTQPIPSTGVLKLKVRVDPLPLLKQGRHLRLDFNAKLTEESFYHRAEAWLPYKAQIDFIEDPFPYDPLKWEQAEQQLGIPLAHDATVEPTSRASIFVIKPARQDPQTFRHTLKRLVMTSYLAHPLERQVAAYFAAQICPQETCGLTSDAFYQETPYHFSEGGTGFGYDDLLAREPWLPL